MCYTGAMTDLNAQTISAALTTRRLGRPTLWFARVGSTNDVAHELARGGAGDGLLVVADEQTAGRGRLHRSWWAPPGTCLLMSLLLRPGLPPARAGQLTMCLGLAAVEAIREVCGLEARLKWPNDVLHDGRKLGGMLAELETAEGRLAYAVIGLGLNVNVDFARPDAPGSLRLPATSLLTATGAPVDRLALLAALLRAAEALLARAEAGESLHEAWAARLDTLGRPVVVALAGRTLEGVATGVTPEGALLVRDDGGAIHTVWSGDVQAVRKGSNSECGYYPAAENTERPERGED